MRNAARARAAVEAATVAAVLAVWDSMMRRPADWVDAAGPAADVVRAGQAGVASDAVWFAAAAAVEAGLPAVSMVAPTFALQAPSGAAVEATLGTAARLSATSMAGGVGVDDAILAGRTWLSTVTASVLQDTSRDVAVVDVIATPGARWVRMVTPPCCSRCAVLAGKTFRWNSGFRRHPLCDCYHVKFAGSTPDTTSLAGLVSSGGVRGLTRAEQASIGQGADPGQVINARRSASGMYTHEGTTKRGWARAVMAEYERQVKGAEMRVRLTPSAIQSLASDRAEAVMLLARNGYLSDRSVSDVARLGVRQ